MHSQTVLHTPKWRLYPGSISNPALHVALWSGIYMVHAFADCIAHPQVETLPRKHLQPCFTCGFVERHLYGACIRRLYCTPPSGDFTPEASPTLLYMWLCGAASIWCMHSQTVLHTPKWRLYPGSISNP